MFSHPRAREPSEEVPRAPAPEDLSHGAITRAVLNHATQHPLTTFPLAASAILGLAAVSAASPGALALAILCGIAGASNFVIKFFFRGEAIGERYVAKIMAERERAREREIENLRDACEELGFDEGSKELGELTEAYQKLRDFLLNQARSGAGTHPEQFLVLAEDAYKNGIGFLKAAVEVKHALETVDVDELQTELDLWQRQKKRLESTAAKGSEVARLELNTLNRKIEIHERRIRAHEERAKLVQTLMAKSETQEGALELAYLELVELMEGGVTAPIREGAREESPLERRVAAARRVEEKLRAVGSTSAEDEMYLKAARERNGT